MMPEDLLNALKDDDVRDLIGYLRTTEDIESPSVLVSENEKPAKVVISGKPSHGRGGHEHRAGSDVAREVDRAFNVIGGICLALLIGIVIFMLKFSIQYHRSRTPRTQQIHGHLFLEIMWIVAPTIIVV